MKIKICSVGIVFAAAVLFFPVEAWAEIKIDVTDHSGTAKIFDEDNIYPGKIIDHTITIKNISTAGETADLYFNFDVTSGSDLASQLKLYVIRTSDNSFRIGGEGDRFTLKDLDGHDPLYVDRLDPDQSRNYKIKIKFNSEANNDYQNKTTKFDLQFGVETTPAAGPPPLRGGFTGNPPTGEVLGQQEPTKEQPEGEALGEEKPTGPETSWWDNWYWAIPLGAILLGSYWMLRKKRIKTEEGPKVD